MNNAERKGLAIAGGIFMILYILPLLLFSNIPEIIQTGMEEEGFFDVLLSLLLILLPLAASVLLILRKPKAAAVMLGIIVVGELISMFLPPSDIVKIIIGTQEMTVTEMEEHVVTIPRLYVLYPISELFALLFFSLALFFRGWKAFLLAVLAISAQILHTILELNMMQYTTGHPSPLNLVMPFNFICAVLFSGMYLMMLDRKKDTVLAPD